MIMDAPAIVVILGMLPVIGVGIGTVVAERARRSARHGDEAGAARVFLTRALDARPVDASGASSEPATIT